MTMFSRVGRRRFIEFPPAADRRPTQDKFDAVPGDTRRFLATLRSQAKSYRNRDSTLATMLDVLHDELLNGEVERLDAVKEYRLLMDRRSTGDQP